MLEVSLIVDPDPTIDIPVDGQPPQQLIRLKNADSTQNGVQGLEALQENLNTQSEIPVPQLERCQVRERE